MKRFSWQALIASEILSSGITAEIARSEEPWAIAITLTCTSARDEKNCDATPREVRIPSPTSVMMATLSTNSTGSSRPSLSSSSNASASACCAKALCCASIQKLMLYSEED
ncbi:Uncharacterised protein [Vibrio cholerae]|nr:Uncharacterised protein [Vibrio cholerae]